MSYAFGAGALYAVPTGGGTPIKFGVFQEGSFDFSFNTKELHGSYQFPVAIARGTGKITGKAKMAQINGSLFNSLFFNGNMTTGQVKTINGESGTIPATPFQITVANSVTFSADLGVIYTATGVALSKVASAPTTGQYSVNNGVYTFASADTGLGVNISYTYTSASAGKKISVTNQMLGITPTFTMYFSVSYNGQETSAQFYKCTSSKLSFSTKMEDFMIPELDFAAFANDSGQIFDLNTAD